MTGEDLEREANGAASTAFVGFLFGNVDENFELDEDYLSKDERLQLGALSPKCFSEAIGGFRHDVSGAREQSTSERHEHIKAEDAQDFAEEEELADEAPAMPVLGGMAGAWASAPGPGAEDDDYDDD
eukprot:CAMPEP_0177590812 /NCGR_PEP_ID=MMETSP0419_2-20121207/7631_1 /TAXON_ID=582737 /ORGANISM="Tetraselmis sp., Strain GSL018" /LENGTH=126 /DNA_ID=CAMNT_0019081447 /DNA_START=92 /DNA_END=469 /DNA_ORIENTATION=+